jgi:transposase
MSKHQLWAQRIVDWQASGLSQRAFCQQQGLAISTFQNWLRKIRQASNSSMKTSSAFLPMVVKKPVQKTAELISIQSHVLSFDLTLPQLAQLITELNRHA